MSKAWYALAAAGMLVFAGGWYFLFRTVDAAPVAPVVPAAFDPAPVASFVPIADAPVGATLDLDRDVHPRPRVLVRHVPSQLCVADEALTVVQCKPLPGVFDRPNGRHVVYPALVTRDPDVDANRHVLRFRGKDNDTYFDAVARADGEVVAKAPRILGAHQLDDRDAVLLAKQAVGIGDPTGAELVIARDHEGSTKVALPALDRVPSDEIRMVGSWVLWQTRGGGADAGGSALWGYRIPRIGMKASDPALIAELEEPAELIDSCAWGGGRAIVLGYPRRSANDDQDEVIALFETGNGFVEALGVKARLFVDPDPAFDRAEMTCDSDGFWLTWRMREPHLDYVRCTPKGCERGNVPGRRFGLSGAYLVELDRTTLLVASTVDPEAAVVWWGEARSITEAEPSRFAEGASVVGVMARGEAALVLTRKTGDGGKLGAYRASSVGVSELRPMSP